VKVAELGEFGLISLLQDMISRAEDKASPARRKLIIGIGDDTAAWHGEPTIQLATVDAFIQGVHFLPDITPWHAVGWKSLAVNLSDIAAMGGRPSYALVSLALPAASEVENITELYRGMLELAGKSGVSIIGGNLSLASEVALHITVLGSVMWENLLTRSGAKAGDEIAVTGCLGAATAGYRMFAEKLTIDAESAAALKGALFYPCPRLSEGQALLARGIKAAIDVSDGLVADLGHICEMSRLGARVNVDAVPIHPAVRVAFGDRALAIALAGGEDYELVFTGSAEVIAYLKQILSTPVTVIGEMTPGEAGVKLVDREGNPFELAHRGWDHFED